MFIDDETLIEDDTFAADDDETLVVTAGIEVAISIDIAGASDLTADGVVVALAARTLVVSMPSRSGDVGMPAIALSSSSLSQPRALGSGETAEEVTAAVKTDEPTSSVSAGV